MNRGGWVENAMQLVRQIPCNFAICVAGKNYKCENTLKLGVVNAMFTFETTINACGEYAIIFNVAVIACGAECF